MSGRTDELVGTLINPTQTALVEPGFQNGYEDYLPSEPSAEDRAYKKLVSDALWALMDGLDVGQRLIVEARILGTVNEEATRSILGWSRYRANKEFAAAMVKLRNDAAGDRYLGMEAAQ